MPLWGIVGAFALLVALGVGTVLAMPAQSNADPNQQPRPVPTFSFSNGQPDRAQVVFIGDSYTGGSGEDSGPDARWTTLLDNDLNLAATVLARGGSGYVNEGPVGPPLPTLADEIPSTADLIVIMGSRNDDDADDVQDAANAMYDAVRVKAPNARVLIIGPPWTSSDVPDSIIDINAALSEAAAAHGFDFVDPTETGLLADRDDLIGADGVHPNDAGHVAIADFVRPLVQERIPSED